MIHTLVYQSQVNEYFFIHFTVLGFYLNSYYLIKIIFSILTNAIIDNNIQYK